MKLKRKSVENPLAQDLEYILAETQDLWEDLRGRRLFITGGTGFFGSWLLESFAWANDRLDLRAQAQVLTRNLEAFRHKAPHLVDHPAIRFCPGDVQSFVYPPGPFSHIIHGATDTSAKLQHEQPLLILDTIIQGTRRILDFAISCGAQKFLLTSSGAVYGRQPAEMTHIPEDYPGAPDTINPASAYGNAKRLAENLCAIYARNQGLETKIARGFAFVGPYLPLDTHFAIGNFIRDGLRGGPILVTGDGAPYRSYLYAAELSIWLWTILLRGKTCRPYNVGSGEDIQVGDLAQTVAQAFNPKVEVHIAKRASPNQPAERYVPSTTRAWKELNLQQNIDLKEAVRRTITWHSSMANV